MANPLYLRSGGILISMYTMTFAVITGIAWVAVNYGGVSPVVAGLTVSPAIIGFIVALLFLFVQFLISPWIMDLQLRWLYDMTWGTVDILPEDMRNALVASMQKHNFTISKVGIIHDQMPNAFTYGRFKKDARMVFTEGIINLLNPDERVAVLEHEVGHIVNRDFVFMTLAQAIPLLMYYTYLTSKSFADSISETTSGSDSDAESAIQGVAMALYGVAFVVYLVYLISTFMVLFLSRTREYLADHFSVIETGNANAMSTALVKVAYGLVLADGEQKNRMKDQNLSSRDRRNLNRRNGFMKGLGAMGLADTKTSEGLVIQAMAKGEVNAEAVAAAAAWDIHTPWAKVIELGSTHPLTGKRLQNLDRIAPEVNQDPKYPDLGKIKPPESLWDEFLVDLFAWKVLPTINVLIVLIAAIYTYLAYNNVWFGLGIGLIIIGPLYLWRINLEYPGSIKKFDDPNHPRTTVLEAMTDMTKDGYYEASPIRGKPIVIQGTLVGRGQPGFVLGEDFVVQDDTGLMVIDFESIFGGIGNLIHGYKLADKLGQQAVVVGWYHRSTRPYVKLHRAYLKSGDVMKNRIRQMNVIFTWLAMIIGAVLVGLSFTVL